MYTTLSGKEISLSKKIAKGGEGEVFEILGDRDNCIKIYHEHIRSKEKEGKLKYMVLNPPSDLQGITYKICWPKDVIYKEGEFVGFLMPKAFDDSLLPYHLCQPLIPKKLSSQWHTKFDRKTFKGITSRLKLSVNIVAVVNRIHNNKRYIIVDLKPQNLLVTAFGKISIIDMDSVQIVQNEKILFKAPVSTPEYTPPEASDIIKSKTPITKDWDTFSLGVMVYEILCGIHPYVGSAKPPYESLNTIQEKIKVNLTHITEGESAFSVLPSLHKTFYDYNTDLKNIFKRIFCSYKIGITVRPSLEEFGETLFNAVALLEEELKKEEQKRLKQEKIKKKLEEKEAIKNYKKLKQTFNTVSLDLDNYKAENITLKQKLNTPSAISIVLIIILTILSIYWFSSNNALLKEYNLLMDDYNIEIKNLKTEVTSLKNKNLKSTVSSENLTTEINKYKSEVNALQNKIKKQQRDISSLIVKFAPVSISEIIFDSFSGTNDYGFKAKKNNLPRSKTYYLYPIIKYDVKRDQTLNIEVKYFNPEGSFSGSGEKRSLTFRKGNSSLELKNGWGNKDGNWLDVGQNKIEIWLDGVKLYQQYFTVTDN